MSEKFQNKYRIESSRLKHWDYRWAGSYFITICTKDREYFLGDVTDGKMQLSHAGVIADILWHEIKNHTRNIELGEFIVMPNHVHGILILNENDKTDTHTVETLHATSLQKQSNPSQNKQLSDISPKPGSISVIIRSYKSAVTKHCNLLGFDFSWQPRFHDHIIRDEKSFQNISDYIINNPVNWSEDKFFKG
jgi:REP element-mobilizing transposase RayT